MKNDTDIVKFLLHVEDLIPNVFEGMTEFETNLFEVLERQEKLRADLIRDPRFKPLLEERPDRNVVKISLIPPAQQPERPPVDQAALQRVRSELQEAVELLKVDPKKEAEASIAAAIRERLKILSDYDSNKFSYLLIATLPPEKKKELFPLPMDRKIEVLKAELTPAAIASMKESAALGLTPENSISMLQNLVKRDRELEGLFGLALFTRDGSSSLSVQQLSERIRNLGDNDAEILGNKDEIASRIRATLNANDGEVNRGKELLSKQVKAFAANVPPKPPEAVMSVELVEQPPTLSVFKGCVGSDCATKNLAAFSHSPFMQAWFIDPNQAGGPRGYVETALVKSGDKTYLYVPTINGKRVNADQAEAILRGLYSAKEKLKFDGLLLPTGEQMKIFLNYEGVRSRLQGLVYEKQEVPIEYFDAELRKAMIPYAESGNYHSPDIIRSAVIYAPGPHPAGLTVKAEISKAPSAKMPDVKLNRGRMLLLAVELENNGRKDLTDRILKVAAVDQKKYQSARRVLENSQKLPVADYFKSVSDLLKAYDFVLDSDLSKLNMNPFYSGLIRAPDAFEKTWREKSVVGSLVLLQKGADLDGVAAAMKAHPEVYASNVRLKNMFLSAAEFEGMKQHRPALRIAEAMGRAGIGLSEMPDVKEALLRQLDRDYYFRKGAGGVFAKLGENYERALPVLFGLAHERSGGDREVIEFFNEAQRRNPKAFKTTVLSGLKDERDWVQRGALYAVEYSRLRDADVLSAVDDVMKWHPRSDAAYGYASYLVQKLKKSCKAQVSELFSQ